MKDFWVTFLSNIEKKTTSQIFETWFKPLVLKHFSTNSIIIYVPNKFFTERLIFSYLSLIKAVVFEITNFNPEIIFEIKETDTIISPKTKFELSNKNSFQNNINSNYTFSNFVVGPSNQFAHAAAKAVSNNPGGAYNPFFIYGGVGLGKTHLLHSIFHSCLKKNKNFKAYYLSSEKFTNELINSIRYDKMSAFRAKYRKTDMLLIDDIQFIAGKTRTMEEFFHTFNSLYEIKKQIIVTSDKTPGEIDNLEDRIKNRFQWGLTVDIQPPDVETKVAIIIKKALSSSINIPNDVAFLLANSVKSNVRELEGLLTRLSAYSSLSGKKINIEFTKDVLKDFLKDDNKKINPSDIIKTVAFYFNIKKNDLISRKKNNSIVKPRQISMYLIRKETNYSLPEIGRFFGGKDHSTVLYSIKKIEALLKSDKTLRNNVNSILKNL
ncbi:MAG: chromosomal replication initiator protein DnaA [Alphaproteobacteria bacterium]